MYIYMYMVFRVWGKPDEARPVGVPEPPDSGIDVTSSERGEADAGACPEI